MNNLRLACATFLVSFIACDSSKDGWTVNGWTVGISTSEMDGELLTAEKKFTIEENPTTITARVQCAPTGEVTITLLSHYAEEKEGLFQPSPFVAEKGRLKLSSDQKQGGEFSLDEMFTLEGYNNVLVAKPAVRSAFEWMALDEGKFWEWARSAVTLQEGISFDRFELLNYVDFINSIEGEAYMSSQGLLLAVGLMGPDNQRDRLMGVLSLTGVTRDSRSTNKEAITQRLVAALLDSARKKPAFLALAPGAFTKRILPIRIEVFNSGGGFQLALPAGNAVIDSVLDACEGQPWWDDAGAATEHAVQPPASGTPNAKTAVRSNVESLLRAEVWNLTTAQRYFFGEFGRYAMTVPQLERWYTPSVDVDVTIDSVNKARWVGVVRHKTSPMECKTGMEGNTARDDGGVQCRGHVPSGPLALNLKLNIPNALPDIDLSGKVTNEADFTSKGVQSAEASKKKPEEGQLYTSEMVDVPVTEAPKPRARFFDILKSAGGVRYPDILKSAGVEGEVTARFVVDTLGRVEVGSFEILNSSHTLFSAAVRAALSGMQFIPAKVGQKRVRQLVQQTFDFAIAK